MSKEALVNEAALALSMLLQLPPLLSMVVLLILMLSLLSLPSKYEAAAAMLKQHCAGSVGKRLQIMRRCTLDKLQLAVPDLHGYK